MTRRVIDYTFRRMALDLSLMVLSGAAILVALVLGIGRRTAAHLARRG